MLLIHQPGNSIVPFFGPQAKRISPSLIEPADEVMRRTTPNMVMPGLLDKDGKETLKFKISLSTVAAQDRPKTNCLFDKEKIQKEKVAEVQKQKEQQKKIQKQKEEQKARRKKETEEEQKDEAKIDEKDENAIPSVRVFLSLSDQRSLKWESSFERAKSE
jgi:hypothetical protein